MEKQIIRLGGSFHESHFGFMQVLVALFKIAGFARDHDIGPVGFSAAGFGTDMIHSEEIAGNSTILAGEIITS